MNITCIICPIGCNLHITVKDGVFESVRGNRCSRGSKYAYEEVTHPVRTLTTTIRVKNKKGCFLPVKSNQPLPKEQQLAYMDIINEVEVCAPIKIGDVVIQNIGGTGIDIVAAKNV